MAGAIIFVGVPASGKSTYYKRDLYETHVRINLDMLKTRKKEGILLHACLAAEQSFVIDNTNLTKELRVKYITLAKAEGYAVTCVYFPIDKEDAIERNKYRDNKVPNVVIYKALKNLEEPTIDEGFDDLISV